MVQQQIVPLPAGMTYQWASTLAGAARVQELIARNAPDVRLCGITVHDDGESHLLVLSTDGVPGLQMLTVNVKNSAEGNKLRAFLRESRGMELLSLDVAAGRAVAGIADPFKIAIRDRLAAHLKLDAWNLDVDVRWSLSEDLDASLDAVLVTGLPPFASEGKALEVLREGLLAAVPGATTGWSVKYDARGGRSMFTYGEPLSLPDVLPADMAQLLDPSSQWTLPYGVDALGQQVAWVVTEDPMGMGVGRTGTGKTVFVYAVICAALARGWEVAVCEVSKFGGDFLELRPYIMEGGWGGDSKAHASQVIQNLYALKGERMAKINAAGHKKLHSMSRAEQQAAGLKPVLLVVDEAAALLAMPTMPKGLPKDHPVAVATQAEMTAVALAGDAIRRISSELRACGVHLLFLSQVYNASLFTAAGGGVLRAQLGHRVVLGTMSRTTLGMSTEMPDVAAGSYAVAHGVGLSDDGAELPKPKPGRGIVETSTRTRPVQCVYAPEDAWIAALEARGIAKPGGSAPELDDALKPGGGTDEKVEKKVAKGAVEGW